MRKIQFRAWENNLKEIIPVNSIDFEKAVINKDSAWRVFDEVILMQYTGLRDCNGKEIYEGDIVKSVCDVYEVIINDFMQIPVIDSAIGQGELYKHHKQIEVVGNIYENPELLIK